MTAGEQKLLAIELAIWIAEQVRRHGAFRQTAGAAILDSATSPLASACYALWSVGCATTTGPDGNPPEDRGYGTPPPHFRLASEAEIRLTLQSSDIAPKSFSRLIGEFAGMRAYEPDAFELSAEWFRPSLPLPLLDVFVAAGFAERSQDRYRWTELMAQWIEWSAPKHLWESPAEVEARHLKDYGPVWKTMPPRIRERVVDGGKLNKLMLVDAIRRFWDDGEWKARQLPDWEDQARLTEAMHIGDELQRLLEARRLRLYWLYPGYKVLRWLGWRGGR